MARFNYPAGGGGGGGDVSFTAEGCIAFPNDGEICNVPDSSGDGSGYSTIQINPDMNTNDDRYIVIDPTGPNHIHIRAGGTQDASNAELILGGERNKVAVSDLSKSVIITTAAVIENTYVNANEVNNADLIVPDTSDILLGDNIVMFGVSYPVTYFSPDPNNTGFSIVRATGATFVAGDSYTFVREEPYEHPWTFASDGTVYGPAMGLVKVQGIYGQNVDPLLILGPASVILDGDAGEFLNDASVPSNQIATIGDLIPGIQGEPGLSGNVYRSTLANNISVLPIGSTVSGEWNFSADPETGQTAYPYLVGQRAVVLLDANNYMVGNIGWVDGYPASTFDFEVTESVGSAGPSTGWTMDIWTEGIQGEPGTPGTTATIIAGEGITKIEDTISLTSSFVTIGTTPVYLGTSSGIISGADFDLLSLDDNLAFKFTAFYGSAIKNSADGVTWTSANRGYAATKSKYANGKYLAVSDSSIGMNILVSSDGETWTTQAINAGNNGYGYTALGYGNGKWLLGSDTGSLVTSTDTINWTVADTGTTSGSQINVALYGAGKYVVVDYASPAIISISSDAITWTTSEAPTVNETYDVGIYDDNKFVIVSSYSTLGLISTDGVTWTQITLPADYAWKKISYGAGKYVVIAQGNNSNANTSGYAYSSNGVDWTLGTLPRSARWSALAYVNGKFIASSIGSSISAISTDGVNWTQGTMPFSTTCNEIGISGIGPVAGISINSSTGVAGQVITSTGSGVVWGNPEDSVTDETTFVVNGGTIGGTQPTFSGAPLFSGSYVKVGSLVHFQIQVDMDNITSFGTGQYYVDLPFSAKYAYQVREGCLHDISTDKQYGIGGHVLAGESQLRLNFINSNGQDEIFDYNSPTTLDVADNFHVSGTYISV